MCGLSLIGPFPNFLLAPICSMNCELCQRIRCHAGLHSASAPPARGIGPVVTALPYTLIWRLIITRVWGWVTVRFGQFATFHTTAAILTSTSSTIPCPRAHSSRCNCCLFLLLILATTAWLQKSRIHYYSTVWSFENCATANLFSKWNNFWR